MEQYWCNMFYMDQDTIQKYINGASASQLARELNTYTQKVLNFLQKNGIKTRDESEAKMRYKIDSNMFEKIDSNDKAYFLGWLFSDGNVYLGAKRHTISLTLVESDKCILDYLNDKICDPPKKLAYKKERIKIKGDKKYICKPCYKLQIDNKKMCFDLIALGCIPRKSKSLKFPTYEIVPEQYFSSFLRGYFDGDGGVSKISGSRRVIISIDGSENFCTSLYEFFKTKLNITCGICFQNGCFRVSFSSRESVLKFYNYIYKNSEFSLERKRRKIEASLTL